MTLAELVYKQRQWEKARGLDDDTNGPWNATRIMAEVYELEEARDPKHAVTEALDVIIVTLGGLARAAESAGMTYEEIDEAFAEKIRINTEKYKLEYFKNRTPQEAINFCRAMWVLTQGGQNETREG